jgi:hypothetical protein
MAKKNLIFSHDGFVVGQAPAQALVRDFPRKVPVRVKAPDATARPEDPNIIFIIAIPVANNRVVIG